MNASKRDKSLVPFDYWSDPLCIWAFVAEEKLSTLLAEMGSELSVGYKVVPVFGSIPWRFRSGTWAKQGVEGRIEAMRKIAQQHGMTITGSVWRDDPPASSWAPGAAIKAVGLLENAGEVAPLSCGIYQRKLRERLFVHDQNISRRSVQLELAEELDLPRGHFEEKLDDGSALAALWEDQNEKEELKVRGSPTYVFDGGRSMIFGNFEYRVLAATAREFVQSASVGCSVC